MINFSSINKYNGTLRNNFNILINTLKNDDVNKVSLEQLLGFIEDNLNISSSGIETDPIFTASDAASITSSDISNWDDAYSWGDHSLVGYLTSFSETDPIWLSDKPNYLTSTIAAATYSILGHTHTFASISSKPTTLSGYGITDAYPLIGNPSGFLTSFTETDPIYSSSSWFSTTNNSTNWNTAYSWGNHASAGYLTSLGIGSLTQAYDADLTAIAALTGTGFAKRTGINTWTLDTNTYITGITSSDVTTALGFTPYNSSNPSGYITASSSSILSNKSGNISQWTNDSGYITSSALSSYVPTSRTLTINGSAQDLSTNRSWTVGDVSTSSSYANPSWITSLAFSKVTSLSVASGDTTNNLTNTLSDFTGLSASITAGTTYLIIAFGHYDASSTAIGSRWTLNGPSLTFISYRSNYSLSATTQTTNHGLSAYQLPAAVNSTSAATTGNTFEIQGIIKPSASGTLQVQFACETNLGSITAKAGSCLILIPIA